MHCIVKALQDYPELALFFTLSLGYAVGKIHIGNFTFLFALGYNVGPQFFKGLKKDGLPQVLFSVIVCGVGLVSVLL